MSESHIASLDLANGTKIMGEIVEETDVALIIKRPVGIRVHTHPVGVETYDWQPFSMNTEFILNKRSILLRDNQVNLYGYYLYQDSVDKIYEDKITNELKSKSWFDQNFDPKYFN